MKKTSSFYSFISRLLHTAVQHHESSNMPAIYDFPIQNTSKSCWHHTFVDGLCDRPEHHKYVVVVCCYSTFGMVSIA